MTSGDFLTSTHDLPAQAREPYVGTAVMAWIVGAAIVGVGLALVARVVKR